MPPVRTVVPLMRLRRNRAAARRELPALTVGDVEATLCSCDAHRDKIEDWMAFDKADDIVGKQRFRKGRGTSGAIDVPV